MCLGARTTAGNGTAVILQPCGLNSLTLWIDMVSERSGGYDPMINGSDTLVSSPYVLTAGPVGAGLTTSELGTAAGTASPGQEWHIVSGVL
jgi:hypothetical protein